MTEIPLGLIPPAIAPTFDYTSRDFSSIREQLITVIQARVPEWNPDNDGDFGMALLEAMAYLGDMMSYAIDRIGNEAYLPTATQRKNVLNHAYILGYSPNWPLSAEGQVTFTCTSTGSNIVVPKRTVVIATITDTYGNVSSIPFETTAEVTVDGSAVGNSQTVSVTHGRTSNPTNGFGRSINAVSDGSADQSFTLPDTPIAWNSLQIYTKDQDSWTQWTRVENLIDYNATDLVYTAKLQADDTVIIEFGDDVNGAIPPSTHEVYALYRVGGGTIGNVVAETITTIEDSTLASRLSVVNPTATSGGASSETTMSIRENASLAYRANDRAVTTEDVAALARAVSGVRHANVDASVWSSIKLVVAPTFDGSLFPGLDGTVGVAYGGGAGSDRVTGAVKTAYSTLKSNVVTQITPSMMAGSSITMYNPEYPRVKIAVSVTIMDGVQQSRAKADLIDVIANGLVSFDRGFGTSITVADIIVACNNAAPYLTAINVTDLHRKDQYNSTGVQVTKAEWNQILVMDAATDLTLTITGGINDL